MDMTLAALLVVKLSIFPFQTTMPVTYSIDQNVLAEHRASRENERQVLNNVVISSGKHRGYNHFVGLDPNNRQLSLQIAF